MKRPVVIVLVLLVAAGAVLSLLRDPDEERGPQGTLALRRFLGRMGAEVSSAETPPGKGTFVLLDDIRDRQEARKVLSWVRRGGRLVVADSASVILSEIGAGGSDWIGSRYPETLRPGCVAREAAGVRSIAVAPGDSALSSPPGAVGCFPAERGPFLVAVRLGSGSVVALGGSSPLRNELLLRADNALLALRLFPVDAPVVFGPPAPAGFGQGKGLWESLPPRAKAAAAGLALAVAVFAFARGRRLGMPVPEEPLTVIPAGQLAHATAGLYRNARAVSHAGGLLRRATAWRLARRLALPASDPPAVARALAAEESLRGLAGILDGPPPGDDTELVALGGHLAELETAAQEELR